MISREVNNMSVVKEFDLKKFVANKNELVGENYLRPFITNEINIILYKKFDN